MQQEINNNFSKEDEFYMKRAIGFDEAEGLRLVPMVP